MAQSLELLTATVKFTAGQPRQTTYGERINVVVTLADGTEQKLWGNPGDPTLTALKKGQQVQLAKDAKGLKLVQQPSTSSAAADTASNGNGHKANWTGWTDEEKRAIASKINAHADLLGYCLKVASEKLGGYCENSEDVRSLAITLFLQALK